MEERIVYPRYRWLMLLATCVAIICPFICGIAYAPILEEIAKDLKVDMGAASHLMTVFVLTSAIALTLGGVVCDKYGITAALVLGLLCASIPAAVMPWIGYGYNIVFFSRLIQGVSGGFPVTATGSILALWFPHKEKGLAGGLLTGSLSIGSAIGVVASPAIFLSVASWQKTVAILSIPGFIGIVLALIITRRPPPPQVLSALPEAMESDQGRVTFGNALFLPITWIGSFISFFGAWSFQCVYNLVPAYLAAEAPMGVGFGPMMSGKLSLAITIVGIFSMLIGGIFFDKVAKGNPKPGVMMGFIFSGIFAYLILSPFVYNNLILLIVSLLIAGWAVVFSMPQLVAFVAMIYPPNMVGRMVGWWLGFGAFGGAVGLYLGGVAVSKSGNFNLAITMISLVSGIGFILAFFLKTPRGRSLAMTG